MSQVQPQSLNDIVGNKTSIDLLRAIITRYSSDKKLIIPHIFIVDGPSGAGKTIVSKLFIKELLGELPRKFDFRQYPSLSTWEDLADYSSILFEDAHNIFKDSWDFLCVLMDLPSFNSFFIFTTTDYAKLPASVKSRAFRIPVTNLDESETVGLLSHICSLFESNYQLGALQHIAQMAKGNPKAAMTMLQKCDLLGEITLDNAKAVAPNELDSTCHSILCKLGSGALVEAQRELAALKHPAELIIDTLFTTYAAMYLKKLPGLGSKLSDLSKITEIFLRWKGGIAIDISCLPLLLSELFEDPRKHTIAVEYEEPVSRDEPIPREVGARELARLLHAKVVTE